MSYKLNPVATSGSPKAAPLIDRCSGLTWAASLAAACGSAAFGSTIAGRAIAAEPTSTVVEPREAAVVQRSSEAPESTAAPGEAFTGFALPTFGSPSTDGRLLRAAKEVPAEAGKTLDLLFRFASKYRLRNTENGADVIKFKDVMSENRTQSSGVKALGVELLFPFQ